MTPICWAPSPATITLCGTAAGDRLEPVIAKNMAAANDADGAESRGDGEDQEPSGQHRPRRPASTRHVGGLGAEQAFRSTGLSVCGSPNRRHFSSLARAASLPPYSTASRARLSQFIPAVAHAPRACLPDACTHTIGSLYMSRTRQAFFPARLPLYSPCRIRPAMAINAVVISRSDPGAVPGASTTCPCEARGNGHQFAARASDGGELGSTKV